MEQIGRELDAIRAEIEESRGASDAAYINRLIKVQQGLGRDPHGGEIFCFRGRRGDLLKILWHDGVGMSLYAKRLEAGKFIWPVSEGSTSVAISAAQLGYLLEGIDWRNPRWTQRPGKAG